MERKVFRRFDPSTIRECSSILFVGGKRTGKSTVMREFLKAIKSRVYDAHVWSGSHDPQHPWEWYIPQQNVHYCDMEFQKSELEQTIATQHARKRLALKYGIPIMPPSVCVFEDLEFLKPSIWNDQWTRAIILNGRWVNMYFFVAYQYVMAVKMEMRGSFDYAVFTIDTSPAVRKRIYDQFCGMFATYEQFDAVYKLLTCDYRVMVADLRTKSYDVTKTIFWYRADPDLPRFKMGHPDSWVVKKKKAGSMAENNGILLLDDDELKSKKKKKKSKAPRRT